jgi:hypothetical protein
MTNIRSKGHVSYFVNCNVVVIADVAAVVLRGVDDLGSNFHLSDGNANQVTKITALHPGLPDFSWYMIPKPEKYTKLTQNVPNGHKNPH